MRAVNTPATNYLFRVRDIEKVLGKRMKLIHSVVAKRIFVAKRARPDILLPVSVLTTRVKEPDCDDWRKLIRLLSYLDKTEDLHLNLSCKSIKYLT